MDKQHYLINNQIEYVYGENKVLKSVITTIIMKNLLTIKKFGPIEDICIHLKRINIFIGEQGVGKSTIAKLYSCMQDILLHFLIITNSEENQIKMIFQRYGIHTYFNENTYLEFHTVTGYVITYNEQKFTLTHPSYSEKQIKDNIVRLLYKSILHSFKGAGVSSEEDFEKLPEKEKEIFLSNMRTSFYLPAERGLVGCVANSLSSIIMAKVPIPKVLLEYLSFFEKAKNEYPEYEIPFLKMKFKASKENDKILLDNKEVDFKYCSSGIQSIAPMLMIMDYCLKQDYFNCFALEEPEMNLFPTNQLELVRYIISKINQDKGIENLIITTHSPYILSILNISILAGKIVTKFPMLVDEVSLILKKDFHLKSSEIEVFSLGKDINDGIECKSIFDSNTGLIQGNYLDAVSNIISSEFNRLNRLYIKTLREL